MTDTRAALVSGASSGMGRAIALALAEDGYDVTAVARREDRLRELEREAADLRGSIHAVSADVTDEAALVAAVAAHRARTGRLDVLVGAAGLGVGGQSVATLERDLVEAHLATNMRAPMILSRETFDLLKAAGAEHGKALVVHISSVAAKLGPANMSAYGSTKAGLRAFNDSLRAEFAGMGVQVVTFLPSFTASEMSAWLEAAGLSADRLIQPSDMVAAVRFLLSTSAGAHVPELEFSSPAADAFIAGGGLARAGGFGGKDSEDD